MDSEAAATLDFVVSQTWKCLAASIKKKPVFSAVFYDEESVSEIATAANLTFAPGLLDVAQAPTPPDITFFKKTPTKSLGLWAIYNLVLEKKGCTPVIYIGEGSDAAKGLPIRWRVYDRPKTYRRLLPSKVKEALDAGYKITHKGVLAWCPIPSASNVPRFRVLNYAMEAGFNSLFWAMYSQDYEISSCCPWSQESFTYGGLCSHSSLEDPMRADLKLSPEQLESLAAQTKENQRLRQNEKARHTWAQHREADPVAFKQEQKDKYAQLKEADPEKLRDERAAKHLRLKADPVRHAKAQVKSNSAYKIRKATVEATKQFFCAICNRAVMSQRRLDDHNASKKHLMRARAVAAGSTTVNQYHCPPCNYFGYDDRCLRQHMTTDKHKANVAAPDGLA